MMNTPHSATAPLLWPLGAPPDPCYISPPPPEHFATSSLRHIAILGSTGSIGRNALAVAEANANIRITALAGGDNVELLVQQALRWQPAWLAVRNDELAANLRHLLPKNHNFKIVWGAEGYATLAALPDTDCVLSAQGGISGLVGTITAALAGKVIALANKESLVTAGGLLRRICQDSGACILPVDSEHYALFQCVAGRQLRDLSHLILTASGGPFLRKSAQEIAAATPQEALHHPNWRMGAKISIDSATMMNKGLELIEAVTLFGVKPEQVRIVIQPQSIIHSLAQYRDNSLLAQLAVADMRLPISGCLLWPRVIPDAVAPLDLASLGHLDFLAPDPDKFPCLTLAREAIMYEPPQPWAEAGLNPACIALNAANEAAVGLFLRGHCSLPDIPRLAQAAMSRATSGDDFGSAPVWPQIPDIVRQGVAIAKSIAQLTSRIHTWTEACASTAP